MAGYVWNNIKHGMASWHSMALSDTRPKARPQVRGEIVGQLEENSREFAFLEWPTCTSKGCE